jgi:recombination protein RecA
MADLKNNRQAPVDAAKDKKDDARREAAPAPRANGPEAKDAKVAPARPPEPQDKEARDLKDARNKVLDATLTQITKQFGKGSIMRLGKSYADMTVSAIPTGALSLDLALGVGGVPQGRITEIYGPESSGKTTLALHVVAEAQRKGGTAAFIDVEHALDPEYAMRLGVNVDELLVSQPSTGEEALEIVDMLLRSAALDVIVVDSVAALVPKAELEGEMGDSHVGLQARLMSQAMRKITGSISKSKTACIFINQIRMKIGVMFGNPETTTGGNALKFYASVRLDVRRIESLKEGDTAVGNRVRVKVSKNKLAPPFKVAEFDVMFGQGISREGTVLDLAIADNLIEKSGAWFSFGDQKIGQGRENVRAYLSDHPELMKELEEKIIAKHQKRRKETLEEAARKIH